MNYLKHLKKDNDNNDIKVIKKDYKYIPNYYKPNNLWSVRHQKILNKSSGTSFYTWEYKYFKHLLKLSEIFSDNIKRSEFKVNTSDIYFLDNFARFIRASSTGEISPYLEETEMDNQYSVYSIKRHEWYNKDE
jgi:hypothetical protein